MFIIIEGVDFCGKTTFTKAFVEALKENGLSVVHTREPGGTPMGEAIRSLLLDPVIDREPETELSLFFSARLEHLNTVIKPALAEGNVVVCERFVDSSYVYQVAANKERNLSDHFNKLMYTLGDIPERTTYYLELPLNKILERMLSGERSRDRIESKGIEYFQAVSDGFKFISSVGNSKNQKEVLDVDIPLEELFELAKTKALEISTLKTNASK